VLADPIDAVAPTATPLTGQQDRSLHEPNAPHGDDTGEQGGSDQLHGRSAWNVTS